MKVSAFSKIEMSPLGFDLVVLNESEVLHVGEQELSRTEVIRLYIEEHIKQKAAAKRIGLSTRQI